MDFANPPAPPDDDAADVRQALAVVERTFAAAIDRRTSQVVGEGPKRKKCVGRFGRIFTPGYQAFP
jgi:hypothetical protein